MAAIGGNQGPAITLNREQEADLLYAIEGLKKITDENTKQIARQLKRPITQRELNDILNQAYQDFAQRVHQTYDRTKYAKDAEALISCFKLDFFSNKGLNKEIRQIVIIK